MNMYNILVLAGDTGSFLDSLEKCTPTQLKQIHMVYIVGDTLPIQDIKKMQTLQDSFRIQMDVQVSDKVEDIELFTLGRCYENNTEDISFGLICYRKPSDKTISSAKKIEIPLLTWNNFLSTENKPVRGKRQKKEKEEIISKESPKEIPVEQANIKPDITKKKKTVSTDKSLDVIIRTAAKTLHYNATQTKTFLQQCEQLSTAIDKALDPDIGLPLQIRLYCHLTEEECKALTESIKPTFQTLKNHVGKE